MRAAFLRELKRRRVLHTAWLYVVGAWIALQVVEVLSGAGLPPATMRNLLVLLSIGFPVALVAGWFFDISKDGIRRTRALTADEAPPDLKFIDHVLLAGLLGVVAIDAWILSIPPPAEDPVVAATVGPAQRTIAVLAFEDLQPAGEGEAVGETFAEELRRTLTLVPGLRVLGRETSRALAEAGEERFAMARELQVTALLVGEMLLREGRLQLDVRLIQMPVGNELWSTEADRPVGEAVDLQNRLAGQVVQVVAPGLDPDPVHGQRAGTGECNAVYDRYLRGKKLSQARRMTQAALYQRGMQLLRDVVAADPACSLAWEALAIGELEYTTPGFARSGAAARRALELNERLPEAWTVLAEIAEQEKKWGQAEEYLLRALYVDPTNVRANFVYSEALMARGRLRDAVRYALEAYRYEPASINVNFRVMMAADQAGESDLVIEHGEIWRDLEGRMHPWASEMTAEARLAQGDVNAALAAYEQAGGAYGSWFMECIRAHAEPERAAGVRTALRNELARIRAGDLAADETLDLTWRFIRCGIWLDEPDLVFEVLDLDGLPGFEEGFPTEMVFVTVFYHDAAVLRRHPRFRALVLESGLVDYWKKWGWADACRPEGDGFACD